jgi:hypothetical protein
VSIWQPQRALESAGMVWRTGPGPHDSSVVANRHKRIAELR